MIDGLERQTYFPRIFNRIRALYLCFFENQATGALIPKGLPVNSFKTGFRFKGGEFIYE